MRGETILVKLGGAVITDKKRPYRARIRVIERLAREIKATREKKKFNLIIGHGSGSFAHTSAKIYQTNKGFIAKDSVLGYCLVQNDAAKLNRIVTDIFLKVGLNVFSLQPSACILGKNGKIAHFDLKPFLKLLDYNIIPIVYGDAVIDLKKGCTIFSTEEILSYLAKKLKVKRVLFGTKEKGVYVVTDKGEKKFLQEINKKNWREVKKYLSGSEDIDVTGGMLHKVEIAIKLAKLGYEVNIFSERFRGNLKEVLLGRKLGTRINW